MALARPAGRFRTTTGSDPERRHTCDGQRGKKPWTTTWMTPRSAEGQGSRSHAVPEHDCAGAHTVYSRGKRNRRCIRPLRGTKTPRESRLTTHGLQHAGGKRV